MGKDMWSNIYKSPQKTSNLILTGTPKIYEK